MSGFSMPLPQNLDFSVFLLFSPVSHIWDRVLGISVLVIICKVGTNATCLIELF